MPIRAIETRYSGVRFRSRLEARYAVFFDRLRISWEYEPEGYVLSSGECYIPDFWLPSFNGGTYVEVKPTGGDFKKALAFALDAKVRVWLADGPPKRRWYTHVSTYTHEGESRLSHAEVIPCWCKADGENRFWFDDGSGFPDNDTDLEAYDVDQRVYKASSAALSYRFGT